METAKEVDYVRVKKKRGNTKEEKGEEKEKLIMQKTSTVTANKHARENKKKYKTVKNKGIEDRVGDCLSIFLFA